MSEVAAVEATPVEAAPVVATVAEPTAAPVTAPVSELVTPPAVEVTVLNDSVNTDGVIEYEETGDPALDVALGFLGTLGFAGSSDAMVRAAKGDFALLEAQLATMGTQAQGWERMVALAKSAHATSETTRTANVAATDKAIMSVVGDKASWDNIVKWAATNADPAEKAEINKMIDGGPIQARAAATLLLTAYKSANGTTITPASATRNAAGAVPDSGRGPLNAQDYNTAVRALSAKLGNRMETSQEYADLQRRLR